MRVIVTIARSVNDLAVVVNALEQAGLVVDSDQRALEEFALLRGRAPSDALDRLRAVAGVERVEPDGTRHVQGPGK